MVDRLEPDVRRKIKRAEIVFAVSFATAMLVISFGENLGSGTVLGYILKGSILISMVSGFYAWIVTAWNYNPD